LILAGATRRWCHDGHAPAIRANIKMQRIRAGGAGPRPTWKIRFPGLAGVRTSHENKESRGSRAAEVRIGQAEDHSYLAVPIAGNTNAGEFDRGVDTPRTVSMLDGATSSIRGACGVTMCPRPILCSEPALARPHRASSEKIKTTQAEACATFCAIAGARCRVAGTLLLTPCANRRQGRCA
jgi:hypothetical protein